MINYYLIKLTRYSLRSPQLPSTIVCWPGNQASLGSRQSLVLEVQHNIIGLQEMLMTRWIMHAKMYFIVSTWSFVRPRHMIKPNSWAISAAWFATESTQLVRNMWWHNLTTIRAALMKTSLKSPRRHWPSSQTILFIISPALLLLLDVVCNSQLFCRWLGLQSPTAASLSPAATATATETSWPPWPGWRIRD